MRNRISARSRSTAGVSTRSNSGWRKPASARRCSKERFVAFGQGYRSMSPALRDLETMILERRLRHGNHPLLSMWMANATIERDHAGNRKLSKLRSSGRIDGALAMAIGAAPGRWRGPSSSRCRIRYPVRLAWNLGQHARADYIPPAHSRGAQRSSPSYPIFLDTSTQGPRYTASNRQGSAKWI